MKRFFAALLVLVSGSALANISVVVSQSGSDVVFSFSGSLNVVSFGPAASETGAASAFQSPNALYNAQSGNYDYYLVSTGQLTPFENSSSSVYATSQTVTAGNDFAIDSGIIHFSAGYNNTPITSNMTFSSQTISGLGLIPGTYVWTLPGSQTVTLIIPTPPSAVPSLSEWAQLMLALMVLSLIGWHFHRERSY